MLNEEKILILNKDNKDITSKVIDFSAYKIVVKYGKKSYTYNSSNLKIIFNPVDIENCIVTTPTTTLLNVSKVIRFDDYIKVFFNNGKNKIYNESELIIKNDILNKLEISKTFNYFKEMASNLKISDVVPELRKEDDDSNFLSKIYEKVEFINEDSVVNEYINEMSNINLCFQNKNKICPFSFNLSQQEAVKNAFSNKISVIE